MNFLYFSHNGSLRPQAEAAVPLANIEYCYGFGVYESIRVVHGTPVFLSDHTSRLFESARILQLDHQFDEQLINRSIKELIETDQIDTCNLKLLLIGGHDASSADLYIIPLAPRFPDKKWYRDGVKTITYQYERYLPQAKSLNMLGSYLAYRSAKAAGCYDALLLSETNGLTEGTRTNLLALKGDTLISPPTDLILHGVTRKHVLQTAAKNGLKYQEEIIRPDQLSRYDALLLSSTSSKLLPICQINDQSIDISETAHTLIQSFSDFIEQTYTSVSSD